MRMESSNRVEMAAPCPVTVSAISSCTRFGYINFGPGFGKAKCIEYSWGLVREYLLGKRRTTQRSTKIGSPFLDPQISFYISFTFFSIFLYLV